MEFLALVVRGRKWSKWETIGRQKTGFSHTGGHLLRSLRKQIWGKGIEVSWQLLAGTAWRAQLQTIPVWVRVAIDPPAESRPLCWLQCKKDVYRKWKLGQITKAEYKKLTEAKKKSPLQGYKVTKTTLEMSKNRMCMSHTRRKKDCICLTLSLDYFFCCSGIFTELIFLPPHIPALFKKRNISCHITMLVWEQWDRPAEQWKGKKKNSEMAKRVRKPGFLIENHVVIWVI